MTQRLDVVIVNYRGAADVLECLESLLRSQARVRVVVVDNASGDGSADTIAAWARGEVKSPDPSPALAHLSRPPLPKPISHLRLDEADSLAGPPGTATLTVIDAANNGGFAAGNNIGLRYLLADPATAYVWLLNPDTVVDPNAAAALLEVLHADPGVGMCGAQVRYYHSPGRVQALGGHRFNRWTGTSRGIAAGCAATDAADPAIVARDTDFVLGAALAVTRPFLETVGLMEESYFLYYEEIDWAWRNRGRFAIGYAPDAVVYHKEGGTIGSSSRKGGRSDLSEYYLVRSRLRLMGLHRPWLLPVHWGVAAAQIALRLLRRQPDKAAVMMRALFGQPRKA